MQQSISQITPSSMSRTNDNTTEGRDFWKNQIARFKQTALSRKDFCRQHHLIYHRFQYWYRQFENSAASKQAHPGNRLLPVTLKTSGATPSTQACDQVVGTLVLRDETRLLLHDHATLDHVLRRLG
ncbi:MAG TPA: hypothetical protein VI522_03275 [Gammaproteobacteria bacterium]|nr:hypothetical protein [Gammaproteobacteria bacterium]